MQYACAVYIYQDKYLLQACNMFLYLREKLHCIVKRILKTEEGNSVVQCQVPRYCQKKFHGGTKICPTKLCNWKMITAMESSTWVDSSVGTIQQLIETMPGVTSLIQE